MEEECRTVLREDEIFESRRTKMTTGSDNINSRKIAVSKCQTSYHRYPARLRLCEDSRQNVHCFPRRDWMFRLRGDSTHRSLSRAERCDARSHRRVDNCRRPGVKCLHRVVKPRIYFTEDQPHLKEEEGNRLRSFRDEVFRLHDSANNLRPRVQNRPSKNSATNGIFQTEVRSSRAIGNRSNVPVRETLRRNAGPTIDRPMHRTGIMLRRTIDSGKTSIQNSQGITKKERGWAVAVTPGIQSSLR